MMSTAQTDCTARCTEEYLKTKLGEASSQGADKEWMVRAGDI